MLVTEAAVVAMSAAISVLLMELPTTATRMSVKGPGVRYSEECRRGPRKVACPRRVGRQGSPKKPEAMITWAGGAQRQRPRDEV